MFQTTLTPALYLPLARLDPSPMPSPTPTLGPSDIRIMFVDYNPPFFDITNERVDFHNFGGPQVMTGWTLSDDDGNVYNFPSGFAFGAGA